MAANRVKRVKLLNRCHDRELADQESEALADTSYSRSFIILALFTRTITVTQ